YVVNEDDKGETYLLFPLPGQALNPLPARTTNRIPGASGGQEFNWQVTSAGGREHFLIFASPERLTAFEQMFANLPHPEREKVVRQERLPEEAVSRLRGVGGLTAASARSSSMQLAQIFGVPLGESEETVRGLWVRQLTLDNPK